MMPKGDRFSKLKSGDYGAERARGLETLRFLAGLPPEAIQRLMDVSRGHMYNIQDALRGPGPRPGMQFSYQNELPMQGGIPLFTPTGVPYGEMPPVGLTRTLTDYQKRVLAGGEE